MLKNSNLGRKQVSNSVVKEYMWKLPVISCDSANVSDVSEGVDVMPNSTVEHVSFGDGRINLRLNNGNEVRNGLSFHLHHTYYFVSLISIHFSES